VNSSEAPALSPGWALATIREVADVKLGKMLSRKAFVEGLVVRPYLRNENVQWGRVDLSDVKTMGFRPEEFDRYGVLPGDLLVCEGGEPGRCAVYTGHRGTFWYQKALHRVRPRSGALSPQLLQYWLWHLALNGDLLSKIAQTTIQHLPLERFVDLTIPVPPFREQARIVEAIESYFSRMDEAVTLLERVERNLKRYRAAVLKAAVEGRLVPTEAEVARAEGRDYEAADVLLKRILAERRRRRHEGGGRGKYDEPIPPDTKDLPELPEGWCWATADMLAELKGGITKGQTRKPTDSLRAVPYLRVANVQRARLDLSVIKTILATEAEIDELRLQTGDVLFNEGGDRDKLGRGWVWNGELPECIHQNHVFRARILSADLHPKFMSWYGNTAGQQYFFEQGKQTTNLASINLTKLRRLPLPIPPLVEQMRIVQHTERLLSLADEAELLVKGNTVRCARLRQAILKWAFDGKLVDQDPSDEPASVLLERIRMETATRTAPGDRTGAKPQAGKDRMRSGTMKAPR